MSSGCGFSVVTIKYSRRHNKVRVADQGLQRMCSTLFFAMSFVYTSTLSTVTSINEEDYCNYNGAGLTEAKLDTGSFLKAGTVSSVNPTT